MDFCVYDYKKLTCLDSHPFDSFLIYNIEKSHGQ